jgi:predicted GNAT family acetyltransferase
MDLSIQRSVVAQLSARPQVVEVGPFVLGWDPTSPSKFISYATPRPGAVVTPADVAALVAAFREIDRIPRLEYVVSTAPELEKQLVEAGFAIEARHEYLVCSPSTFVDVTPPDGVEIAEPVTDADFWGMITAQAEAFGDAFEVGPGDVDRSRRTVARGGVVRLARNLTDGLVVGGGQASPPSEGVAEVAGIAVTEAYRRRGIAGAITAAITRETFSRGVEGAWLEASGEESWRVYERVGFVPTGKRLYIALES